MNFGIVCLSNDSLFLRFLSLLAAAAKAQVAPEINDKATADLMTKFYQRMLKQGERPAAALRAAQVEMWKQKQWQSPYYWAAFTMQGEWK
jgi:CHAT domain-containing protein